MIPARPSSHPQRVGRVVCSEQRIQEREQRRGCGCQNPPNDGYCSEVGPFREAAATGQENSGVT